MKITPWVDITCEKCGAIAAGSGYYYKGIITELQNNTKDWGKSKNYNRLCPQCLEEEKEADRCDTE